MTFHDAIVSGFRNYVEFSGRASRSEFWYWTLFVWLVSLATIILDTVIFPTASNWPINSVWGVAVLLPGLAVAIRRLHDIDRTGWWFLLAFTIIGIVLLFIWACMPGTAGRNRFGPDPLGSGKASRGSRRAAPRRSSPRGDRS